MCFKSSRLKHNILALIVCNQIHQHFMESMTNKLERQQCTIFSFSMQTPSHYTLPKILTINFLFSFIHQVGGAGSRNCFHWAAKEILNNLMILQRDWNKRRKTLLQWNCYTYFKKSCYFWINNIKESSCVIFKFIPHQLWRFQLLLQIGNKKLIKFCTKVLYFFISINKMTFRND